MWVRFSDFLAPLFIQLSWGSGKTYEDVKAKETNCLTLAAQPIAAWSTLLDCTRVKQRIYYI